MLYSVKITPSILIVNSNITPVLIPVFIKIATTPLLMVSYKTSAS